jgi:hypothetical protein
MGAPSSGGPIPKPGAGALERRAATAKEFTVKRSVTVIAVCTALVLELLFVPVLAAAKQPLIGNWMIVATKEPGKPYRKGYKGRPFVPRGANAFTLLMEYRDDGTFRRISRIGNKETVHEGTWVLAGHELRHKRKGAAEDEVMYVRFDDAEHFTSIEVFEKTHDPGLFARFRRVQ